MAQIIVTKPIKGIFNVFSSISCYQYQLSATCYYFCLVINRPQTGGTFGLMDKHSIKVLNH